METLRSKKSSRLQRNDRMQVHPGSLNAGIISRIVLSRLNIGVQQKQSWGRSPRPFRSQNHSTSYGVHRNTKRDECNERHIGKYTFLFFRQLKQQILDCISDLQATRTMSKKEPLMGQQLTASKRKIFQLTVGQRVISKQIKVRFKSRPRGESSQGNSFLSWKTRKECSRNSSKQQLYLVIPAVPYPCGLLRSILACLARR